MSVLLRQLPLLVVGCLLLQSLQLTAGRNCNLSEETAANNHLKNKFTTCPTNHVKQHLPFNYNDSNAVTDIKNLKTLCQDGYIIRYSTERRTPLFTAEQLVLSTTTPAERINCFRRDPRLTIDAESSSMSAYNIIKSSGYTKGHIAPAGDMVTDIPKKNTFILSNIAPQYETHNNHPWNDWEKYARQRAKEEGVLFVITGVTGQLKNYERLIVPKYFYKILVWCENGVIKAEYIYCLHSNVERPPTEWGSSSTKPLSSAVKDLKAVDATYKARSFKTVAQVENFIETKTNIKFEIGASNICQWSPYLAVLSWLKKYYPY